MARAIAIASNGLYTTDPNPRVGCVIVKNNKIISEGWHQRAGGQHAEIHALSQCGDQAKDSTVYVSLEPCCHQGRTPPCTDALIKAQVNKVVIGCLDPNPLVAGQGIEKLQSAGIVVEHGVQSELAESLNPGFMKRMRSGLPFIRCKIAMSIDGRTAMASGESQWITGEDARADVQNWRARSSAILTGIETILIDDPSLNVRLSEEELKDFSYTDADQPVRLILDTALRFPENAKLLSLPGKVLIYTCAKKQKIAKTIIDRGVDICYLPGADDAGKRRLSLNAVLKDLADRGINEVLVEAGATLNGALMAERLIDELIFYIAPSIMGDQARPAFHLPLINKMSEKIQLTIKDTRQIGVDWRIIAQLADVR